MNVLILGGTQFTGPFTVQRLIAAGHRVTVFHRGRHNNKHPEAHEIIGDRNRLGDFAHQFHAAAPDVVINMLAVTESDAQTFVAVFRGVARRAVVVSSADVYRAYGRLGGTEPGPPDPVPLAESAPLREKLSGLGAGYNKTAVERIVKDAADLPATILRFPAVYGPGDGQHRLHEFVKRMDDGRPAILIDQAIAGWRMTHGYVEDVAYATFLAATQEKAAGHIYNVGDAETPSWSEWIRRIGAAAGWTGNVIALPGEQLPPALAVQENMEQDMVLDTTAIRRDLGYQEQVPQAEALRQTIAWERANPPQETAPETFDYAAEDTALRHASGPGPASEH